MIIKIPNLEQKLCGCEAPVEVCIYSLFDHTCRGHEMHMSITGLCKKCFERVRKKSKENGSTQQWMVFANFHDAYIYNYLNHEDYTRDQEDVLCARGVMNTAYRRTKQN